MYHLFHIVWLAEHLSCIDASLCNCDSKDNVVILCNVAVMQCISYSNIVTVFFFNLSIRGMVLVVGIGSFRFDSADSFSVCLVFFQLSVR